MTTFSELVTDGVEPEAIAAMATSDETLLADLLKGISPENKKCEVRHQCQQILLRIVDNQPEVLYGHWDYFVDLLRGGNSFPKMNGIYIIAGLTAVDAEGRFDRAFDTYFGLLDDEAVSVAAHIAGLAGKIARAQPRLRSAVVDRLFNIDQTRHLPERQDLIKGYAIQSLGELFDAVENKEEIIEYVRRQLKSSSPRTRKAADKFLKGCAA